MLVYSVVRHLARGAVAAIPGPLLARLDRWSRSVAERRAERRRKLLMQPSQRA